MSLRSVSEVYFCLDIGQDASEETFSDSPAELRLMHVIEKCVRGIRCMVIGQDASDETFSDSPAELRLMHVIEKCVRGILCMVIGQDASEETSRIPLLSSG